MQRVITSLTQRRLMPVAILLLVGVIAVPALLLKSSSSAQPAPPAGTVAAAPPGLATVVQKALTGGDARDVSVGTPRDPFSGNKRASSATAGQVTAGVGAQSSTPAAATPTPASSPSGATSPASTTSSTSTTTTSSTHASAPSRVYTTYSVSIRFAAIGTTAHLRHDVPRLLPLPTPQHPVSLFLGVIGGGSERRATFLVPLSAQHSGNGVCRPRRRLCRVIALRPGQSETLTVSFDSGQTRQYRVSVVHLHAHLTTDATVARAAHDRVSPSGECLFAALFPVTFSPATGRLTEVQTGRTCNYILNGRARPIDSSGLR